MKKFILAGVIAGVFVAFLVLGLPKIMAQEKAAEPKPARMAVASGVAEVIPGKTYLAGSAKLVAGRADVKFEDKFSTVAANIKVIVTPVGSWSGIYVMDVSPNGFTVRSETGNPDAEFNWFAVSEK